jgi:glutathionyl-hydroquinone reductase
MVRDFIISTGCIVVVAFLLNYLQDKKDDILNWAGKDGSFKRQQSQFRNWIENKPDAQFPPEKDRYHLYVSYACPWAHRALIVRQLKGLQDIIPVTSVHWEMLEKGRTTLLSSLRTTADDYRLAIREEG